MLLLIVHHQLAPIIASPKRRASSFNPFTIPICHEEIAPSVELHRTVIGDVDSPPAVGDEFEEDSAESFADSNSAIYCKTMSLKRQMTQVYNAIPDTPMLLYPFPKSLPEVVLHTSNGSGHSLSPLCSTPSSPRSSEFVPTHQPLQPSSFHFVQSASIPTSPITSAASPGTHKKKSRD